MYTGTVRLHKHVEKQVTMKLKFVYVGSSLPGRLSWVKFCVSMWIITREARCTESPQTTHSYMTSMRGPRCTLTESATCGGARWTGATRTPRRAKVGFSAGTWGRTSLRKSTLSRKDETMAGEPERASPATIRSCVPTARLVGTICQALIYSENIPAALLVLFQFHSEHSENKVSHINPFSLTVCFCLPRRRRAAYLCLSS